jgi:hypothetical protein
MVAADAARTTEVVGAVGGLPISVVRMTAVGRSSSRRRGSRGGLPWLGHHVFFVYLHHPDNSLVVSATDQVIHVFYFN